MGVFYEVRVHLAENADDFVGKKGTTVSMGIRKVNVGWNISIFAKKYSLGPVRLAGHEAEESDLHRREGVHVWLGETRGGGQSGQGGFLPRRRFANSYFYQQQQQEMCQKYSGEFQFKGPICLYIKVSILDKIFVFLRVLCKKLP